MLCPQCDAKVDSHSKYCPSCGASLPSTENDAASADLSPSSKPAPTIQKKRMPMWFKLISFLAVIALIGVTAGILFTERLVDVVDHQLVALKNNDLAKAYNSYTSHEFQQATSFDQFQKFIETYPSLANNQSTNFTQRSLQNNTSTLKGTLTSIDHKITPIEYKLIKENGRWKILSIRLLQPNIDNSAEEFDSQELLDIVKTQLEAIQHHNLTQAYQQFTSREFKETTSEEAFNQFVKKYPILTDYTQVSLHKPVNKNGINTIAAILKSDQTAAYLKYYLIYEDGNWKIWSMRILSPSEAELETQTHALSSLDPSTSMAFSSIKLGNQINNKGVIVDPTTHFQSDTANIYVNVEIAKGIKGNTVYLNFQHLESGSFISAKALIEENGDSMLMSVFSPPAGGWPKGAYKLILTSSQGLNQIVNFDIN